MIGIARGGGPGDVGSLVLARLLCVILTMVVTLLQVQQAQAQSGTMQKIRYGEILAAEHIVVKDQATGRGAQTGATVGAIAGYAVADSGDRWLGSLLGGALGGAAGHAAEKSSKTRPGWELIIRLDNGEEIGILVPSPKKKKDRQTFNPGDRVRLMVGPNGQTQVTPA